MVEGVSRPSEVLAHAYAVHLYPKTSSSGSFERPKVALDVFEVRVLGFSSSSQDQDVGCPSSPLLPIHSYNTCARSRSRSRRRFRTRTPHPRTETQVSRLPVSRHHAFHGDAITFVSSTRTSTRILTGGHPQITTVEYSVSTGYDYRHYNTRNGRRQSRKSRSISQVL